MNSDLSRFYREMLNATMKTPDRLMANLKRHVLDEFKTYVGYTLNYPETVGFVQNVMNVEDYKEKTFMVWIIIEIDFFLHHDKIAIFRTISVLFTC